MSQLERIICHGNRSLSVYDRTAQKILYESNHIECADGFTLSVIAGEGTYCEPRPGMEPLGTVPADYRGPYSAVEVGYPSERPEPWDEWKGYADHYSENDDDEPPWDTVFGYVPVDLVRALIDAHGGEKVEA